MDNYFKKTKHKQGQALVEFALVFPFFILVVLGGIIDFGICANNYITLQNIVANAAEYAANNSNAELAVDYIKKNKPSGWENINIEFNKAITLKTGGKAIKIIASYVSPIYTPFYQILTKPFTKSKGIKLTAVSAFKIPESLRL